MEKYPDIEGRMSRMGKAERWGSSEGTKEIRSDDVGSLTNLLRQGARVIIWLSGPIQLDKRVTVKSYILSCYHHMGGSRHMC
jgi:hypothetical protein